MIQITTKPADYGEALRIEGEKCCELVQRLKIDRGSFSVDEKDVDRLLDMLSPYPCWRHR